MIRGHRSSALVAALVVVLAVVAAGCSSDEPDPAEVAASEAMERRFEACARLGDDIAAALQEYVDQYAVGEDAVPTGPGASGPSLEELQQTAEGFARRRAGIGCSPREFQVVLQRSLGDLGGDGPYASAIAARVRDQVLPPSGPPETVTVEPGDDLAAMVHAAAPGALVQLQPGTHTLDEPLVLLRETRLVGAGTGETLLSSAAPGAVVVQAGGETLHVEGLTMAHVGREPASVLVVAGGGHDLRDLVVRGGVGDAAATTGWGLVLAGDAADGALPEVVTGLLATGNDAGGVAVAGRRAPDLQDVEAERNGACGLCWLEAGGGTVTDARVDANQVGVSVAGTATPSLVDVEVTGSVQIGALFDAASAPTVQRLVLRDNGGVGLAVRGESTPDVTGLVVTDHDESAVLIEGGARPRLEDLTLGGSAVGLFARGTSALEVVGIDVSDVTEAHVVFAEDSTGSLEEASCSADVFGVVLLGATTVEVPDGPCEITDQRDG